MAGMLSGVRVVELASWTYVPSAGVALADWGADVIKVEGVSSGDPGRALVVGGFTRQAARADVDFILELSNRGSAASPSTSRPTRAASCSVGCWLRRMSS